jgi:hypothetical protein
LLALGIIHDRGVVPQSNVSCRCPARKEGHMKQLSSRRSILTLSALIVCLSVNAISQTRIRKYSPKEAKNHKGQYATVKGTVSDVLVSKTGTVFFHMDGKYPNHLFSAAINKDDVPKFAEVNEYTDLTLEITGVIKIHEGKLEIILKSPKQIRIVQSE